MKKSKKNKEKLGLFIFFSNYVYEEVKNEKNIDLFVNDDSIISN